MNKYDEFVSEEGKKPMYSSDGIGIDLYIEDFGGFRIFQNDRLSDEGYDSIIKILKSLVDDFEKCKESYKDAIFKENIKEKEDNIGQEYVVNIWYARKDANGSCCLDSYDNERIKYLGIRKWESRFGVIRGIIISSKKDIDYGWNIKILKKVVGTSLVGGI